MGGTSWIGDYEMGASRADPSMEGIGEAQPDQGAGLSLGNTPGGSLGGSLGDDDLGDDDAAL